MVAATSFLLDNNLYRKIAPDVCIPNARQCIQYSPGWIEKIPASSGGSHITVTVTVPVMSDWLEADEEQR